jgi:Fur family transcriptional regulator, iron response regulator
MGRDYMSCRATGAQFPTTGRPGPTSGAGGAGRRPIVARRPDYNASMDEVARQAADPLASRLQACGVRPTAQRLRVAAMLLERPQHMTAEQILAALRSSGSRISKATVYNTLNLFAAQGVVRQLAVDGDRAWFDSNVAPHYHFQDVETGQLTDLAPSEVRFERLPPPPAGMDYAGIDVVIRLKRRPG